MSWLYVSTGIMISVNSVLEIDRAIAIISPFHRIQFQEKELSAINKFWITEFRVRELVTALYERIYTSFVGKLDGSMIFNIT